MKTPKVSDDDLLRTFEILCNKMGVISKGFEPEKITAPIDKDKYDGTPQWAMKKERGLGWMIVSGWKGCGCPLSRWNGYIKGKWNFLMMMECVIDSHMAPTTQPKPETSLETSELVKIISEALNDPERTDPDRDGEVLKAVLQVIKDHWDNGQV